jgi:hypothetical protein
MQHCVANKVDVGGLLKRKRGGTRGVLFVHPTNRFLFAPPFLFVCFLIVCFVTCIASHRIGGGTAF